MRALFEAVPDVDVLLALETEELAGKLLFLMRARGARSYHCQSVVGEIPGKIADKAVSQSENADLSLALREAWSWLESQGLLIPDDATNGANGHRVLARRALRMQSEAEFTGFRHARLLRKEVLNPRIADEVWLAFVRGNFDAAVFLAMKAVEVAVREAGRYPDSLLGKKLMQEAFAPGRGNLTDPLAESGEQVGRMELFASAMACYKNPQSHRDVNISDPLTAIEVIYLANHLLRIVEAHSQGAHGQPT